MEGGEDKGDCMREDKGKMRGHSSFPIFIFGEEKLPKI